MNIPELENRMQERLSSLGLIQWNIMILPGASDTIRGKTIPSQHIIEIYDIEEIGAWQTFYHEIIEIKMRTTIRPYRILVNKLIEGYQEIIDFEKDQFIESIVLNLNIKTLTDSRP